MSKYVKDGKFMSYLFEDAKTLYDCARRGLRVSNNGPMLGYRKKMPDGSEPFVWLHYKEVCFFFFGLTTLNGGGF